MKTIILGLFLSLFSASLSFASTSPLNSIGHIQTLKGTVSIQRGSDSLSASIGTAVLRSDIIFCTERFFDHLVVGKRKRKAGQNKRS